MTTNITPIENKIKIKFIEEPDIKLDRPTSGMHHNNASAIKVCVFEDTENGIIIISKNERSQLYNKIKCQEIYEKYQALAPQECDQVNCQVTDQVDVAKCDFYTENGNCLAYCQAGGGSIKCANFPNCYYKQLYTREKTFTVEEIRNILKRKTNKCTSIGICNIESESNCLNCKKSLVNILLAEFEKAVG